MKNKKSGGFLAGILFIIIGSVLLVFNEKNNVKNIKTVDELNKIAINVSSENIDSKNDGKLVGTNGKMDVSDDLLVDSLFNVSKKTAKLSRIVEVYQWDEEESNENDITTYKYSKKWSSDIIDSSKFNDSKSYENPTYKQYENQDIYASSVNIGKFLLSNSEIESLLTPKDYNLEGVNEIYLPKDYYISGNYITTCKDINNPKVGDLRISYKYNNYENASVLAVQSGNSFTPFISKAGKTIDRVFDGKLSASQMINKIENENNMLKWGLRILGVILVMAGYGALISGLNRLLNHIPILGKIASGLISFVAAAIGLIHSLIIIIIAWFRYRPVLSLVLITIIVILLIFIKKKKNTKKIDNDTVGIVQENTVENSSENENQE